MQNPKMIVI